MLKKPGFKKARYGHTGIQFRGILLAFLVLFSLLLGGCSLDTSTGNTNTGGANGVTPVVSGVAATPNPGTSPAAAQLAAVSTNAGVANPTGNLETDIENVVTKVNPAVVEIVVSASQGQGVGTGSIITQDGYILTNFHVVALGGNTVPAQSQVTVVMVNGQKYNARVVGTVRNNDLAVIKVDATGLPTIPMGTSSSLKTGEWVVAIGNALGLPGGPTVTAGIVGAIGRSIQEPNGAQLVDLIQTNAAINPGNSGGPLLNLNGEIVGVNTAAPVDPESGSAAQGIGFAISIDQAKPIVQGFTSGKGYSLPYMGILPTPLTAGLAARYNLGVNTGILISQVQPGSPAANAGWRQGDVIVNMDGTNLTSLADLQKVLNRHKPGDTVQATVVSGNGQQRQTSITFGNTPTQ